MEGAHCYNPEEGCSPDGLMFPIAEYGHEEGRCSITGGYVYRGSFVQALRGTYVFGDYCSGELFGLSADAHRKSSTVPRVLMRTRLCFTGIACPLGPSARSATVARVSR